MCEDNVVTLRNKTQSIFQQMSIIEAMLIETVGPRLKEANVPNRGEGNLWMLESDLLLIECRLDGISALVKEILVTI